MKKTKLGRKRWEAGCKKGKITIATAEASALLLHRLRKTFHELRVCPYCGQPLSHERWLKECKHCESSDHASSLVPDLKYMDLVTLGDAGLLNQKLQDAYDLVHRDDA